MLIIYKSHNYKLLIEKACSIFINSPLSNPLKSEIFITNNENIDHWIKIFISKKYSIASNIKFFRFHKFIWNFSKNISSNYRWTLEFEKYNLIWKMMSIKDIKYLTSFISLSHSQIKLFEIISSLSKKFKEYLLYRPDLIEEWEKNIKKQKNVNSLINKHKLLWKKLIKYIKNKNQSTLNYSNLLFILEKEIQKKNINTNKLPYRIFIFGNKNLTPLNIMFLKIISKICTIYFFYTTPYKNEKKILLNHIKFEKHELTLIKKYTSCFFQATQNYKILLDNAVREKNIIDKISFLGKYGYEYTLLLYLINKKEIHLFKTKKPNYLLQKIQKKIIQTDIKLNCNENKKEMNRKNKIHKDDSSITIHICTTIRREIEVLHENLLNILNTHHDILFHDILIISKDINLYTPFIYSIFNSITPKHYIPFRILSNFNRKTERAIKTIIKILSLPNNPLDNKNIFNLLENPIILKKTKIKEKEISFLYKTIEKFQIEFEFNKNSEQCTLQKNNKKIFLKNTEKRIFLGQAMNDENYTIWKKLVPCNVSNIKNFKTLNKLIQFVLLLRKWKNKLSTSKYLKSWKLILEKLLNDFFENHEHETKEMKSIKNQWNIIIQSGIQENYKKKVSIKLLKNELLKSTPNSEKIHDLFSGKITFCNGFILRNIPFKVICILGMNEEFSTQKTFFENFNIIHKFPRICDPHRKNKYEYLFLETLLSAQKFFLISYYKNSKKKNQFNTPSFIINQLSSYISKNFYIFHENEKIEKNQMKKISYMLYHNHTHEPYDMKNFIENSDNQNFNEKWLKISKLEKIKQKNPLKTLEKFKYKNINILLLIAFWKNPIQNFFNNRLNVKLNLIKNDDLKTENFHINTLNRYKISLKIINFLLEKKDIKKLFSYYTNKNIIPYGNLGKIFWDNQIALVTPLYKKINSLKKKLETKKFRLKINENILYGSLKNINETGLLRWKPTSITYRDIISLWLEHLVYCSMYKEERSIIISPNNKKLIFLKLTKKKANKFLEKYINGYINGMQTPLLLTKLGITWINSVYNKKSKTITQNIDILENSKKNIIKAWEGNDWIKGEKHDLYLKKIINILDEKTISKICRIAKKWILPILQYIE